jgi:hypothetical protein
MHYSQQADQMTFFDEVVEEITPETVAKTTPDVSNIVDKIIAQKPPENETGEDRDPEFANAVRNHGAVTMDVGTNNIWYFDGDESILPDDKLELLKQLSGEENKGKLKKIKGEIMDLKVHDDSDGTTKKVKEKYKINIVHNADELLKLPSKYPNRGFVVEYAHFVVQGDKSVSQPFEAETIEDFARECKKHECVLRYAPESQTPKILEKQNLPKDDLFDCIAQHRHVIENIHKLTFMKPSSNLRGFTPAQYDGFEFKDETNLLANIYRRHKRFSQTNFMMDLLYDKVVPYLINEADFIDHHGDGKDYREVVFNILKFSPLPLEQYEQRKEEIKKLTGVKDGAYHTQKYTDKVNNKTYVRGDLHRKNTISNSVLSSILMCFLGESYREDIRSQKKLRNKLRIVGTSHPSLKKRLMGWAWCKEHYLVFSPHHLKGGVIRSNIKWFSAKAWLKNKQKDFVTVKEPQYNDKGKIINYLPGDKKGDMFASKMGCWSLEQEEFNQANNRLYCKALKVLFFALRKFVIDNYKTEIEEAGIEI